MAIKQVTSTVAFQDPQGNVLANGFITFDLSAPAEIAGTGGQIAPSRVFVSLNSSAQISPAVNMWANDQLNPTNTVYIVKIFNSNGLLVSGPLFWSITGTSPIDLSQEIPVAASTLSFSLPGPNVQIFTSSGTFTIPGSVSKLKVTVIGGGGAGGGADGVAAHAGGGGGSGGATIKWLSALTPGLTLTVTNGAGGAGASNANGGNGTSSVLSSGTQTITSITANGGNGGQSFASGGVPGAAAAVGTGGDLNLGGNSGLPQVSAGNSSGSGGASLLGGGGPSVIASAGSAGTAPGAGGSGAGGNAGGNVAGGAGANGAIIFEWII